MSNPTSTAIPATLDAQLRAFLDDLIQADTPERQEIRDNRPSPSSAFVAGDIVRFLPDVCHIKATADLGSIFHTAMMLTPQPVWEKTTIRRLVGLADDTAPSYQHTGQTKVPTAGGEIFLYPKLSKPYYTLDSITKNGVPETNIIFAKPYATELGRLELACTLIKTSVHAAQRRLDDITTAMCQWRCERRQWELDVVVNEWKHGDMKCLSPRLKLVDLVDAKAFVLRENRKDRAGLINTFFTGRYRQDLNGKSMIAEGDKGGHFTNSLLPLRDQLNNKKMATVIHELETLIDNMRYEETSTANAMFAPVTPDSTQGPSTASRSSTKRPSDALTSPTAKRVTRSQTRDSRMVEAVYQSWPCLRPTVATSASGQVTTPATSMALVISPSTVIDLTGDEVAPTASSSVPPPSSSI